MLPAILGIVIISVLNNSRSAQHGNGIELPVGWQEPVQQEDNWCDAIARYDEGLPLSTQRPAYSCLTAYNSLANTMNLVIGASLGVLFALAIRKMNRKK